MAADIVKITTEAESQSIFLETVINNTLKVNKIADESVLSAIGAANGKISSKAIKDIALVASHIFPDLATGQYLDNVARNFGIAPRLQASRSSTYVRFVGLEGTVYEPGVNTVTGQNGVIFDIEDQVVIPEQGYAYGKIRSQDVGAFTNVNAYALSQVNPAPTGHIGVINEYGATGGRDLESDNSFRARIKEGPNILSRGTIEYLTQAFISVNPDVLRVINQGTGSNGKVRLGIVAQNGISFSQSELDTILSDASGYLSISELSPIGKTSLGVELVNIEYEPIDVSFRVQLIDNTRVSQTARDIQRRFSKNVDFRFFDSSSDRVEWDDLLQIVKSTPNVKYVPDTFFNPSSDILINRNRLPRFRGFQMLDLNGNIIVNQSGTLQPIFYPNQVDTNFNETVL